MIHRFLIGTCLLLITSLQAISQIPENIRIEKLSQSDATGARSMACDNQFAGTIASITPGSAQSNDIGFGDTTFLCFGDSVFVNHANDYNLLDDPSPSTTPGIGYVFYDCPPTVSGPNLSAIQNDPCVNNTSPVLINGNLVYQTNDIWLTSQNSNGDAGFRNDGTLIQAFGGRSPVLFWFAPITIDEFSMNQYYQDPSTGEVGPCVHANINAAFPVVYLNKIESSNRMIIQGSDQCEGSFTIRGGFPEFKSTSSYNITITKVGSSSVTGTISSDIPNHNETVRFEVPESGIYNIVVEDGKSCGLTFQMDFSGCNGPSGQAVSEVVQPGDRVCVDVIVNDFIDIISMQFTINWDPSILDFDGVEGINPLLQGLDPIGSFGDFSAGGQLTFSWNNVDPDAGVTLPDGSVIFQLCFIAIGQVGQNSPITYNGDLVDVEIANSNGDILGFDASTVGRVFISDQNLVTLYAIDTACFNQANGGFTISVLGGTPPYEIYYRDTTAGSPLIGAFAINSVGGSTSVNNISPGTFEVQITDNSTPVENVRIDTITVPERLELSVNIDPVQGIECFGDSSGVLLGKVIVNQVEVMNPGPEFEFVWSTGSTSRVISNLPSMSYSVTLTDEFGCQATTNRFMDTPSALSITASVTDASCSGRSDGALNVSSISGGTSISGNYDISITGPSGFMDSRTSDNINFNNIQDGQYFISITDDNDCTLDTVLTIGAIRELSVSVQILENVKCAGGSDGEIFVEGATTPAPASTPYTFQWISAPPVPPGNITNTPLTSNIDNLRARNYQLIMTDTDGCRFDTTFTITEPDSVRVSQVNLTNETCSPGNDGSVTVNVTGGTTLTGSYTYNWGITGQNPTSPTATGISAGQYTLTVTDDNNCTATFDFTISSPTPPVILDFENDTLNCATDLNGSLTVTAAPGSSPIAGYSWSNGISGANTTTISGLSPGVYYVTIAAQDMCNTIDSALVVAPPQLTLDSILRNSPLCPFDNNGSLIAFVSGGSPPYTYIWSSNPASPSQSPAEINLTAGTYSLTITDANDCQFVQPNIVLEDPPAIEVMVSITDTVSCFNSSCDGGATATAIYSDNSTGNFTFSWPSGETNSNSSSSTATQLCQGNFLLTVTDGTCEVTQPISVPSLPPLALATGTIPVSCFGLSDGEASVQVSGGASPYMIDWSNGDSGPIATGLAAGNITANVTDDNGCTVATSVNVTQPVQFQVQVDNNFPSTANVTCNGGDDGQITIFTSGGNQGIITYAWQDNIASQASTTASDLSAGTYSVTATDSRGCTDEVSHTLSQPPPITFSLDSISPIQCAGFTTIVQPVNISGGNGGPYAYEVDGAPVQDVNFPTSIFAGQHSLIVYDSENCPEEVSFTVTEPNPITITIPSTIIVELGDSLQLVPTFPPGGPLINPDSVLWEPSTYLSCDTCLTPFVTPLESQLYTLTVYDFNGCSGSTEVFVEVDKNRNVYIPNAFSPNGDGINDEFRIYTGPGVLEINYVRIFDRWGNIVYEDEHREPNQSGIITWDGSFKGKEMDPAVFVYLVEVRFQDNVLLLYRGDITLLK